MPSRLLKYSRFRKQVAGSPRAALLAASGRGGSRLLRRSASLRQRLGRALGSGTGAAPPPVLPGLPAADRGMPPPLGLLRRTRQSDSQAGSTHLRSHSEDTVKATLTSSRDALRPEAQTPFPASAHLEGGDVDRSERVRAPFGGQMRVPGAGIIRGRHAGYPFVPPNSGNALLASDVETLPSRSRAGLSTYGDNSFIASAPVLETEQTHGRSFAPLPRQRPVFASPSSASGVEAADAPRRPWLGIDAGLPAGADEQRLARMPEASADRPSVGTIHLDGNALGQWVTRYLERSLSQANRGPSGVDPRVVPMWGPPSAAY